MASRIEIKNEALMELPANILTAEDEHSIEARETARAYAACKSDLLESHDWGFATRRAVLAQTTNDRTFEWLFAYAAPSDLARPRYLVPDFEGLGLGLPVPGSTVPPYFEVWSGLNLVGFNSFLIENGVIYSSFETATLEYGTKDVDEPDMPALFRRALALELASRLAMPIKKDRTLKGDLIKAAEAAKSRAMAENDNRHPNAFPSLGYMDEVGLARSGWMV